ncbi:MAG: helix-turn-helix domain-containing protein [Lachnospirales bacterium]
MTKDEISMASKESGGMFAVIPGVVMKDRELSMSARMLYGIITWKCNEDSRCWPTNRALAEELGLSAKRVSALLSLLEERGHIETELIQDQSTGEVLRRYIYPVVKSGRGIPKNEDTPPSEQGDPLPENAEEKYKYKYKHIPPKAPQGGKRAGREPKKAPDWNPERFKKFWDFYSHRARPEDKQSAIKEWDRLKPSDDLIDKMATALSAQVNSKSWREGIGIPYACRWIKNRRWEDPVPESYPHDSGGTVRVVEQGDLPVW